MLDHSLLMYRMDSLSGPYRRVLSLTLNNPAKRVFISINPDQEAHRKPEIVTIWLLARVNQRRYVCLRNIYGPGGTYTVEI